MSDYRKIAAEIEKLRLPQSQRRSDEVELSQRRRLQLALALESHRTGYEVASVDSVADTAMLSKRTLYALFGSKKGLLESAVQEFSVAASASIEAAMKPEPQWLDATRAGIVALLESVVREPALARLTFVESVAILTGAEESGQAGQGAGIALLSVVLAGESAPAAAAAEGLDELTRMATLNGMAAPLADRLSQGRSREIPDLAAALSYLAINARLGPDAALRALA